MTEIPTLFAEQVAETQAVKAVISTSGTAMAMLSQVPHFPLAASSFGNAFGPASPGGDRRSSFNLWDISDSLPIPSFKYFVASQYRLDQVYGHLVEFAVPVDPSSFSASLLSQAKKTYTESKQAPLDATGINWHLTLASPGNWVESSGDGELVHVVQVSWPTRKPLTQKWNSWAGDLKSSAAPLGDIPIDSAPQAIESQNGGLISPFDVDKIETQVNGIEARVTIVQLNRPWLSYEFMTSGGWYINGLSSGDSSSSIIPLIPISLVVASEMKIITSLDDNQLQKVKEAIVAEQSVTFGPFTIGGRVSVGGEAGPYVAGKLSKDSIDLPGKYLVGWIVRKTSRLPPEEAPAHAYVKTKVSANIRSGPGTEYKILYTVPEGTRLELITRLATDPLDWAHVKFNGKIGYIAITLVAPAI